MSLAVFVFLVSVTAPLAWLLGNMLADWFGRLQFKRAGGPEFVERFLKARNR